MSLVPWQQLHGLRTCLRLPLCLLLLLNIGLYDHEPAIGAG